MLPLWFTRRARLVHRRALVSVIVTSSTAWNHYGRRFPSTTLTSLFHICRSVTLPKGFPVFTTGFTRAPLLTLSTTLRVLASTCWKLNRRYLPVCRDSSKRFTRASWLTKLRESKIILVNVFVLRLPVGRRCRWKLLSSLRLRVCRSCRRTV